MSFDTRDIRRSMDVYTHDNVYLGTVLEIIPCPNPRVGGDQVETPPGEEAPVPPQQRSEIDGEMFGPMPTQTIGNKGPSRQSARAGYAVHPDDAKLIGSGSIRVGKWWGLLSSRTIPIEDVQTVSIERVVLRRKKDEIDH